MRIPSMILAAMLAAAGPAAAGDSYPTPPLDVQTKAVSPGLNYDLQSWQAFADVVKPTSDPSVATFETWQSDVQIYGPQGSASDASERSARFSFIGLGSIRASLHGTTVAPEKQGQIQADCQKVQGAGLPPSATQNPGNFPPQGCIAEEVRRDPSSASYIVDNGLNSLSGLQAYFRTSRPVQFPDGSIEMKADWIEVNTLISWLAQNNKTTNNGNTIDQAAVEANYYTAQEGGKEYALVSMHISKKTKELPNWLWATFEHQWSPGRCDTSGCTDFFDAAVTSTTPSVSTANTQYPSCSPKKGFLKNLLFTAGVKNPVWENYCLKGTQIDFTASVNGKKYATIDGDSTVERILAEVPIQGSSCITCHSTAGFNNQAKFNPALTFPNAPIGPYQFPSDYRSNDFVWGLVQIPNIAPGPMP